MIQKLKSYQTEQWAEDSSSEPIGFRSYQDIFAEADSLEALADSFLDDEYEVSQPAETEGFTLSIIMPVYNEEDSILKIISRVARVPFNKEIILINDCSTDSTEEFLNELGSFPEVKVIHHEFNQGKGAALRTGFNFATGDYIIVQDADLEYDPRDIPGVIAPLVSGEAEIVYGSRFIGEEVQDPSWVHRFGNKVLTTASNLTTGLKITDMETCYKAFKASVLKDISVEQNRFGFEPEITAKLAKRGHKIVEVPITYNARSYAEGKKIGVSDLINAFWCIAKYGIRSK